MQGSNSTLSLIENSGMAPLHELPYFQEYLLVTKLSSPLMAAIILFGVMANIINIIVFLKAGAKENVTILLLSLAVSDLGFLVLFSLYVNRNIIIFLAPSHPWPFDSGLLAFLTYWPAFTSYDLSTFISVSLGVMRCACVAMPLKFKFVFTKSRTVKWVMFLVVLAISLRIPVLTIHRIGWRVDPATNVSVAYVQVVNAPAMSRINDIMNRGVVIYFNYITMVACVIILTFKLYQASKIRRSCTATSSDQSSDKLGDQGLSSKDLQVVKSVVLVCTIFILSQLTFVVTSLVRLLDPRFRFGGGLDFLPGILTEVSRTCSCLNASLNIFVYFNFNSKFRTVFNSLFVTSKN